MLLATAVVASFGLERHGVAVVGKIPAGLPIPPCRRLGQDLQLLLPASRGRHRRVLRQRPDRTSVRCPPPHDRPQPGVPRSRCRQRRASAHAGFPVSSSGSRTAIADSMGGRSQHSWSPLARRRDPALPAARPRARSRRRRWVPSSFAAIRLVDVAEFRRIARFRRSEVLLALATTAGVLFDVLYGVLVAVALSVLDLLRAWRGPTTGSLAMPLVSPGCTTSTTIRRAASPRARRVQVRLAALLRQRRGLQAAALESSAVEPVEWFLLNAEANVRSTSPRSTPSRSPRGARPARASSSRWPGSSRTCATTSGRAGFVERVGEDHIFPTLPTAVEAYVRWYVEHHGARPHRVAAPAPPRPAGRDEPGDGRPAR